MMNRFRRRTNDIEYEQTSGRGDNRDFYDPETMSRRYPSIEDSQGNNNNNNNENNNDIDGDDPPRMDETSRYNPDSIRDYAPDDDGGGNDGNGNGGRRKKKGMNDEEMEHEIDGMMDDIMDIHILNHPRDRARKKRVFILIGTVVVATIILVVTLTATSSNSGSSSSSASSHEHKSAGAALVKAAPSNLSSLCSITSISTASGHDECEKACEASTCCMAAGHKSCFLEKEALCGTYAPCGTLHTQTETPSNDITHTVNKNNNAIEIKDTAHPHGVEVAPPPSDLPFTCNTLNLKTPDGYLSCETTCHHGSCCLSMTNGKQLFTKGSCFASHPDVCGGYESCLNLDSVKPGPTGKDAVIMKCTEQSVSTKLGREQCEQVCAVRSCCFANDERNCRATNKEWCNEYSACEILISPQATQENSMGLELSQKCQPQNLITKEDLLFCENICKPAFGCYFDDSSLAGVTGINCNDFKFCDHVLTAFLNGGVWEDIGTTATGGVGGGVSGYEDVGSSGGVEIVSPYEDTLDLVDENKNEPPLPTYSSTTNTMTTSNTYSGGYSGGSTTTTTTSVNGASAPVIYENDYDLDVAMEIDFDDSELEDEDAIEDNTYGQQKPMSVNEAIEEICSPENLMTNPGMCEMQCQDVMCCFDNGPNGCREHPSCPHVSPCAILLLGNGNDFKDEEEEAEGLSAYDIKEPKEKLHATPAQVQERCATANLVDVSGVHACMSVCDEYMCCFDYGPRGCAQWDDCQQYQACKFIDDHFEDHTPDTMVQLNDACSASSIADQGMEECQELCEPHRCCFDGGCAFGPLCKVYSPVCSVVFENMDKDEDGDGAAAAEGIYREPPEDLEWLCDPDRISLDPETYQYQCDHPCEYAACCEDAANNCKASRPKMCEAYAACFVSYDDEDGDESDGGVSEPPVVASNQPQTQASSSMDENTQAVTTTSSQTITNKDTTTTTSQTKPNYGSQDISELCSMENKQTPGGLEVCKEACQVMACCWDDDPTKNCWSLNQNDCLLYMNCPKDS